MVSQKHTSLQLWDLRIIAKWPKETEQFPQKTAEVGDWHQMAPQISETESLSTTIAKKRLKLLGHILRLSADCPAKKAMRYYFEERNNKMFTGRKRTTIVSRIKADIKNKTKKKQEK